MQSTTTKFKQIEQPETREAISELVRSAERIEIAGSQSHGKMIPHAENVVLADLSAYRGIIKYQPQEYVISAKAGTPVEELAAELKQHNQYLPFDPPQIAHGTTLGGVVSTGLSGPGSLRHGRLRDFIIGVEMVPGTGNWIKGGGYVVKNAAGFDLPKLVVGSLGCFGIIGDIVLKVFPAPVSTRTIIGDFIEFESGLKSLEKILASGMTLDGCVLEPSGRLSVRIAGLEASLEVRSKKLSDLMATKTEFIQSTDEQRLWENLRNKGPEFLASGRCKVPICPSEIPDWQAFLSDTTYRYFYDQAGSVLIINVEQDKDLDELADYLKKTNRSALCIGLRGGPKLMGNLPDGIFANRIRKGLDPHGKFPSLKERSIN